MTSQPEALLLTLVVEAPLVLWLTARWPIPPIRRLACAVLPSVVTHYWAWHTMGNFGAHDYATGVLLIEMVVIAVEGLFLQWLGRSTVGAAWRVSLLANVASASIGLVVL